MLGVRIMSTITFILGVAVGHLERVSPSVPLGAECSQQQCRHTEKGAFPVEGSAYACMGVLKTMVASGSEEESPEWAFLGKGSLLTATLQ